MYRRCLSLPLCHLVATLLLAPLAAGDDLNPPAYRGAALSTSAEWDFLTAQNPDAILPDGTSVPLVAGDTKALLDAAFPAGSPHPSCALFGDVSYAGNVSNGGYRGGPAGDGGIVCNVPNWIDTEPEKQLRIQVTYTGPLPATTVFGFLGVPGSPDGVEVVSTAVVPDTDPSLPAGMSYFYADWRIYPNPDWEQVVVFVPQACFIDQIVIDTVSWPLTTPGAVIFADGVETGDTARWSATVP